MPHQQSFSYKGMVQHQFFMMLAVDNKNQILSHHQAICHMDSVARKRDFLYENYIERKKISCLEVIKLEYSLRLKIKRNDWQLADTCPQAANHCALF